MGPTAAANVFPSHSELKQTTREGLKQHDTHDKQSIDCNPTHRPSLIETYTFFCLKKKPNNAVTSQSSIALIVLVNRNN